MQLFKRRGRRDDKQRSLSRFNIIQYSYILVYRCGEAVRCLYDDSLKSSKYYHLLQAVYDGARSKELNRNRNAVVNFKKQMHCVIHHPKKG